MKAIETPTKAAGFNQQQWATLAMVAAMGLSGFIGLFVKESQLDPLSLIFLRCLIGGLGLWLYAYWRGLALPSQPQQWFSIILAGSCLVLNWFCLFLAYRYLPVAVATVIYNLQPLLLLLLAWVILHESVQRQSVVWILLAFIGVVLVVELPQLDWQADQGSWLGLGLSLMSATFYAVTALLTRRVKQVAAAMQAAIQLSVAVIPLGLLLLWQQPSWQGANWSMVLALALINTLLQYLLLYYAIQLLEVQRLTVLAFIYPLTALLVDILFYQEAFSLAQMLGMGLILLANLGVMSLRQAQPPVPATAQAEGSSRC